MFAKLAIFVSLLVTLVTATPISTAAPVSTATPVGMPAPTGPQCATGSPQCCGSFGTPTTLAELSPLGKLLKDVPLMVGFNCNPIGAISAGLESQSCETQLVCCTAETFAGSIEGSGVINQGVKCAPLADGARSGASPSQAV